MPAAPAIPTSEYSSAAKTFSMSRWAMRLPAVARRSPAMTTPSSYEAATMVVPCGTERCSADRFGSRSGDAARTNSVNEEDPGAVAYRRMPCTPADRSMLNVAPRFEWGCLRPYLGGRRGRTVRSLAALLHERAHEVLGIRLQDVVDLVQDRVDVLGQLLVPLGDIAAALGDLFGLLVLLALRPILAAVVSWHPRPPSLVCSATLARPRHHFRATLAGTHAAA